MAEGRLAGWRGDALALAAGALLPAAFAPLGLWPLAVAAPAVLWLTWLDVPPRRALWRGWLFGLGLFGVGVSWVFVAIHVYGHTPAPLAAVLTFLFIAFLALFPAAQGWLSARLAREARRPAVLVLAWPALWVLAEWSRGRFLTGFPWLHLGYSQTDSPLAGLAPVAGVYGVSLAVAVSAGLVLAVLAARGRPRLRAAGLAALAALWLGAGLLGRMAWSEPAGDPIRVALVQGNVPQITKWQPGSVERRLRTYAALTREHWDADVVIWPENSVTVFYHRLAEPFFAPLAAEARAHGTELLVGLPVREPDGRYHSSFAHFDGGVHFYHKTHLVPFGEYVPLERWLRGLIGFFDLPMSGFSPGPADQAPLTLRGHPVAVSICYEDAFGEELIRWLPRAALLVNGSNNAWYGDSLAPHQHLQISRMRALETARPLLRVTTNGISAITDARGRVLARSPQFAAHVLRGEVRPHRGATPYVRTGNAPVLALALLMVGAAAARRRLL